MKHEAHKKTRGNIFCNNENQKYVMMSGVFTQHQCVPSSHKRKKRGNDDS